MASTVDSALFIDVLRIGGRPCSATDGSQAAAFR
jgi:hypothetical protein